MVLFAQTGLFGLKMVTKTQIFAQRYPLGATSLEINAFFELSDLENGGYMGFTGLGPHPKPF